MLRREGVVWDKRVGWRRVRLAALIGYAAGLATVIALQADGTVQVKKGGFREISGAVLSHIGRLCQGNGGLLYVRVAEDRRDQYQWQCANGATFQEAIWRLKEDEQVHARPKLTLSDIMR